MRDPTFGREVWNLPKAQLEYGTSDKRPLPDGTIFACGIYYPDPVPYEPSIEERIKRNKKNSMIHINIQAIYSPRSIDQIKGELEDLREQFRPKLEERIKKQQNIVDDMEENSYDHSPDSIRSEKERLERLRNKLPSPIQSLGVYVPSGAMEWLLHEVGHWVAASDADRLLPNYGIPASDVDRQRPSLGDDPEVEAWAFEEAVLSHLGPARYFGASYTTRRPRIYGGAYSRLGVQKNEQAPH